MTQKVGLIGYPLGHSISPAFQQAAFDHLKLDIRYDLWETPPENLARVVSDIRSPDKLGANVTVPYKEKIMPLLDEIDALASDIGAVNTVVKRSGKLIGYNTDAGGFMKALTEDGHFDPGGKRVTMIGAGGVARAIGFILIKSGIGSLVLYDIDAARARKLASDLKLEGIAILESEKDAAYRMAVSSADLLVNCTPVGMKHSPSEGQSPVDPKLISAGSLVYDVVYNPLRTPFLRSAQKSGARTLGGLSMLVYQGALAFELWTGRKAPVDIMIQKARVVLG